MKKLIIIISSILQFIAVILFIAFIKAAIGLVYGEIDISVVAIIVSVAVAIQYLSIKLRDKYSAEVAIAENIMQKPKTNYGWIALAVFGVAVLVIILLTIR